ncbi:MAG: glycosyltransferase family 4 protein [Halapricum sp.]
MTVAGPADGRSGIGDYTQDLTDEMSGARVETMDLPMGCNDPVTLAKRAVRAGSADADVIHVQHEYGMFGTVSAMSWVFFPILYLLAAWQRTPVVITIHEGLNETMVVGTLRWAKRIYLHVLNWLIVLNAAHVIFLSKNTAREFTGSVPLASYSILPHGAQAERPTEMSQATAKRRLGYDPEQTVVSQPGYVEPRKGSDRMVELAGRMPDCEFLLAGGPAKDSYRRYFERIVDSAPPNLTVTGFLDEEAFHASFVAADLIVLSHQEIEQSGIINTVNQSGVFNRCATYGKPVVATDIPYFQELERRWGCLQTVDFEDLDEVASVIRALLDDETERTRLSERIREYADSQSFGAVAARHEQIYREVSLD